MKVLHVLAQLPAHTGSGVYFHNLLHGLAKKNVMNGIIYATQPPFHFELDAEFTYPVHFNSKELPFSIVGMSDIMPYPSSIYSQLSFDQLLLWQEAFIQRLIQAKNEFKPDIVVTHHLWYLTSLVLDFYPEIPVVGISHGTDLRQARRHPYLKQKYLGDMNRLDLIFSLTNEDRKMLIQEFKIDAHKIKVTGNGFNSTIFNPLNSQPSAATPIKLLYAGKLTRSKGVFELLLSYKQLKTIYPQVELYLIGNGGKDELAALREYVSSNQIRDIEFIPAVSQFELAKWMKKTDIFILPSYYEGLATICLEAMACGLRTVVTELPPLKNFLADEINQSHMIEYVPLPRIINQDQAHHEDIPDFVERLTSTIRLQIERIQTGESINPKTQQLIMEYSWERLIDKQYHYLLSLLNKK